MVGTLAGVAEQRKSPVSLETGLIRVLAKVAED